MNTTMAASLEPDDHRRSVNVLLTLGAATACYYASRPRQRPDCEHLAVVRYGPTALCADCDRPRSTVGKGMDRVALPDPTTLVEVLLARQACTRAEEALRGAVTRARMAGQPWSGIGIVLDTTRQTAQQRFAEAG